MAEKKYDKKLRIKTIGKREWKGKVFHYNRYEATPYKALDRLFQNYRLEKTDKVVDLGCGRGRVVFYIHQRFHVPVTGIEAHDKTYEEALDNKKSYMKKAKHINAPIRIKFGLAEHYQIKPEDSIFYLFNPFSAQVFEKVMDNILYSLEKHKQVVDVILYYPMPEYKKILANTPFKLFNKVRVPGINKRDKKEKFLIYRAK